LGKSDIEPSSRALFIIVLASIAAGVFFNLLVSSESITQKQKTKSYTRATITIGGGRNDSPRKSLLPMK
jgi:hypothetical protein